MNKNSQFNEELKRKRELAYARLKRHRQKKREEAEKQNIVSQNEPDEQTQRDKLKRRRELARKYSKNYRDKKRLAILKTVEVTETRRTTIDESQIAGTSTNMNTPGVPNDNSRIVNDSEEVTQANQEVHLLPSDGDVHAPPEPVVKEEPACDESGMAIFTEYVSVKMEYDEDGAELPNFEEVLLPLPEDDSFHFETTQKQEPEDPNKIGTEFTVDNIKADDSVDIEDFKSIFLFDEGPTEEIGHLVEKTPPPAKRSKGAKKIRPILPAPVSSTTLSTTEASGSKICDDSHVTALSDKPVGLNHVDYLLKHSRGLSFADKRNIARLGPHQPSELLWNDDPQTEVMVKDLFKSHEWITGSEQTKRFFCFPCLLYGGEALWTKTGKGINLQPGISNIATQHEANRGHIANMVNFRMVASHTDGSGSSFVVDSNFQAAPYHLPKLVSALMYCGRQIIPRRKQRDGFDSDDGANEQAEPSVLESLVEFFGADVDSVKRLANEDTQDKLLRCMLKVYHEHIMEEISSVRCVALMVERAYLLDSSYLVIVFRYVWDGAPVERFIRMVEFNERSAQELVRVLKGILQPYNLQAKLVAQTYDGYVPNNRLEEIVALMKQSFPLAHFVHAYCHPLREVLADACGTVRKAGVFFAEVSVFRRVFSESTFFNEFCVDKPVVKQILKQMANVTIECVYENQPILVELVDEMRKSCWNHEAILDMSCVQSLLEDNEFLTFLKFFNSAMRPVTVLSHLLKDCDLSKTASLIANFHNALALVDGNCIVTEYNGRTSNSGQTIDSDLLLKIRNIMSKEVDARLGNANHLTSFGLVDPKHFRAHKRCFPVTLFDCATASYPLLAQDKLMAELKVLYSLDVFKKLLSVSELLAGIRRLRLQNTFTETVKMAEIVLATPVVTSQPELCVNKLNKIKRFINLTKEKDHLDTFCVLAVEDEYFEKTANFRDKVVDAYVHMQRHT